MNITISLADAIKVALTKRAMKQRNFSAEIGMTYDRLRRCLSINSFSHSDLSKICTPLEIDPELYLHKKTSPYHSKTERGISNFKNKQKTVLKVSLDAAYIDLINSNQIVAELVTQAIIATCDQVLDKLFEMT